MLLFQWQVYGQSGSPSLACSHAHIPVSQRQQWSATDVLPCRGHSCPTSVWLLRCRLGHHGCEWTAPCIGYCVFLSGAAIFWLITRFWKPCLSTFEGELGALTKMAKTAIAARELLASIPLSWSEQNRDTPTTLLIDAAATKQASDNLKHHSRTKHMETFLAWFRHVVREGLICTQTIPRKDNIADFMVKPHTKALHRLHSRRLMGPFQHLNIKLTSGETPSGVSIKIPPSQMHSIVVEDVEVWGSLSSFVPIFYFYR